jgi:hypothetical protein
VTFFSYGWTGPAGRRLGRRMPSWAGAPDNWLPGIVPVSLVVARTDDLVVSVSKIAAYPDGFEFELTTASRLPSEGPFPAAWPRQGAPGLLVGLTYADGARAAVGGSQAGTPLSGLNLLEQGSRGSDTLQRRIIWASPLPPSGPVTFVAAWPDRGLSEATVELDGALLQDAAERAVELWPEQPDELPDVDFSNAPALPPVSTPPADAAASEDAIRAAFSQALDSRPAADSAPLSAIQDGPALAGAVEEMRARYPLEASTSRVVVGPIVFLDDVRAALNFQVIWSGAPGFGAQLGYAVRERGEWKVARDTYCRVLGWAGVVCPPPPPAV